jgi:hypothetical protein
MRRRHRPGLWLALAIAGGDLARADDPALAPGRDPGGTAIAILADGFDYTRADVARILARDGEGEAIAWDAADRDPHPFAAEASGTELALAATARGGVRVVAVRVATGDPASLAQGIAFAAATPARIVFAPAADNETGLEVLEAAAQRFGPVLLIGSAPKSADAKTERKDVPGLILLDAADDARAQADTLARVLGCGQGALAGETGAELKQAFLARLESKTPSSCEPQRDTQDGQQR